LAEIAGEESHQQKRAKSKLFTKLFTKLTPCQREVALGKTNAEIAKVLSITTQTVEAHISRSLATLGFSSRSQIAVWAAEQGLKPFYADK